MRVTESRERITREIQVAKNGALAILEADRFKRLKSLGSPAGVAQVVVRDGKPDCKPGAPG